MKKLAILPVFIIFSAVVYQSLPEMKSNDGDRGKKNCLLFNTRLIFHTET